MSRPRPRLRVDQEQAPVGVLGAAPGRLDHRLLERAAGARREDAGGVDEHQLRVALDGDAEDPPARGLHLGGDDRDLGADQPVEQRRLADVGRAQQRDEAAAGRGAAGWSAIGRRQLGGERAQQLLRRGLLGGPLGAGAPR